MGKQIQIVGANNAPYVAKELDLESGNQFTFAKPVGTDVVEVGALDFIKAIEDYDTFKDWVVNYKRDANTIIPLRIDKIEGNVETEKIVYTFTNDDVDVSSITLVKLIVEMVNDTNEISASYVDETKEIEAGTVLPTPSGDDDGKLLGVADGEYALVNGNPAIPTPTADDIGKFLKVADDLDFEYGEAGGGITEYDFSNNQNATLADLINEFGTNLTETITIKYVSSWGYPAFLTGIFKVEDPHTSTLQLYFKEDNATLNGYKIYSIEDSLTNLEQITIGSFFSSPTYLQEYSLPKTPSSANSGKCLMPVYNMGNWELGYASPLPSLPEDASTKTYVLKAVNGIMDWFE